MEYNFANKVMGLQPSAIREILKFTSLPGVISLAAGNPSPDAFPVDELKEISEEIFAGSPVDALQYSITEGYPALKKTVRDFMSSRYDSVKDFDEIIITAGAQQVMNLATMSLCNEGDAVICEDPSFIGSLNAFRAFGCRLCGVPLESDGMNLEALENTLKTEKKARFIYIIPNFQNPTGVVTSLEKRKAIYELARKYDMLILEDNPYGETRFEGENIPSIKSMDTDGRVIYAGTYSKVISPGMRVGYAIAPAPIIAKMTVCKQVADVHTNIYAQMLVDRFMTSGKYDAHLERIRGIYRRKSGIMMDCLDRDCADFVKYDRVSGGLFIWCTLPEKVDMPAFCKQAVIDKVAVVPGSAFLTDESKVSHCFRLNFSTPTDQQLYDGMEILAKELRSFC
ncbi:MAG: PLP-dependent aminotransferase family protein [Clostridia bacterium]|nr:PLP-dependent aminotransferase family protein [Clostridia bacterium]